MERVNLLSISLINGTVPDTDQILVTLLNEITQIEQSLLQANNDMSIQEIITQTKAIQRNNVNDMQSPVTTKEQQVIVMVMMMIVVMMRVIVMMTTMVLMMI